MKRIEKRRTKLDRLWADFVRDVNPGTRDVKRANAIFKRLMMGVSSGRSA